MSLGLNIGWRSVYLVSVGLRFVFALSDSYIHPDEHFQTVQVLFKTILGYDIDLPWEFTSAQPARSLGLLYLVYGPLLYLIKFTGWKFEPIQIWYLIRLVNVIGGWMITDFCIYRMMPTKPERIKGIYFALTSYITLVHQSHCFSNSMETWLVLVCIYILDDLRFTIELTALELREETKFVGLFALGVFLSVGVFNRVTFPAFVVIPAIYLIRFLMSRKVGVLFLLVGAVLPTIMFIVIDTYFFSGSIDQILQNPWRFESYVVTPLNNLLYNSKTENLAQHGLHPFYTHFLVNLPQILGPGIILLTYKFRFRYWGTTPFLSLGGALVILSLVPHQEMRFLVPIVPLACCCFDIDDSQAKERKKSTLIYYSISLWYIFNGIMAVLMGVYHQGGVVPALEYTRTNILSNESQNRVLQIWWRTYMPPTWVLGSANDKVTMLDPQFNDLSIISETGKPNTIIDLKGSSLEILQDVIQRAHHQYNSTFIVLPVASYKTHLKASGASKEVYNYGYHLDLDHIDFSDWTSLHPGLGIYQLL